jgi:hypothetical protein
MDEFGTDRENRDFTLGSAPSEQAPGNEAFAPLHFDAAEFMQYIVDENLSEAEAVELLRAIWEIVVAFVDLRYGFSPLQHLVDSSSGSGGSNPPPLVQVLSCPSISNTFNQETAGRETSATAAKEES